MEYSNALEEIRLNWRSLYPHDKKSGIVCPLCNSGSGKHGDGITADEKHKRPYYLRCWSCGFKGDIIDLMQQDTGKSFNEVVKDASERLGIEIDAYNNPSFNGNKTMNENIKMYEKANNEVTSTDTEIIEVENYNKFYVESMREFSESPHNTKAIAYLTARGISLDTAYRYNVGYCEKWQSPTVIKKQIAKGNTWRPDPTARLIFPMSKNHYIARAIDDNIKEYAKMNETGGGGISLFNIRSLNEKDLVFVVEGIFDALSIIEVGYNAIAINSTSNADILINEIEKREKTPLIVLSLDNDSPGQKAQTKIINELKRINRAYIVANISGKYKDANEYLVADKDGFIKGIKRALHTNGIKPDNIAAYLDISFSGEIEELQKYNDIKTGFNNLDKESGGLYPGLYVLGAISSLGKTTFCHQIADNLAQAGNEVLYFSLEQSRLELVTKSLARINARDNMKDGILKKGVTSLQIRKGMAKENYSQALETYKKEIAEKMSIIEGNFNCDISFIGEYIRRYISENAVKPIVFIDYLQIIQPGTEKKSGTKENIDFIVTELKRISRENNITVIVISSVNRTNYLMPFDFESLKESGGIEYTADVVLGLQLSCLKNELFNADNQQKKKRDMIRAEKEKNPRRIDLVCIKNRYGKSNYNCSFVYYPAYDLFIDSKEEVFTQTNENVFNVNNAKRI